MFKRALAFLLAFCMLTGMINPVLAASSNGQNEWIASFQTKIVSGAEKKSDGKYVWQPDGTESHMFIYRVSYALSGEGMFNANSIEVRIPKSILTDRDGEKADIFDISVPEKGTAGLDDDLYFVYETNGDDIVITNRVPVPAGWAGYIDIGYIMTESEFEYVDYAPSRDFTASICVEKGGVKESDEGSAPPVYIDTNAVLLSTKKEQKGNLIVKWDNSWGVKPEDADNWYYLIWTITSKVEANQPYDFTLFDSYENVYSEIVGYKLAGENSFSDKNTETGSRMTGLRYDYVLTRHQKAYYDKLMEGSGEELARLSYTLDNAVKVSVTPTDKADAVSEKAGRASFTFEQKVWTRPLGQLNYYVYGVVAGKLPSAPALTSADSVINWNANSNGISSYSLDEFKRGSLDGSENTMKNLRFYSYACGNPYPWTAADLDGDGTPDLDNPYAYGVVPLNMVIVNSEFCLPEEQVLSAEDYEIYSIIPKYSARDAVFNESEQSFTSAPAELGPEDVFNIFVMTNEGAPVLAAVYHLDSRTYSDINSQYVDSVSGSELILKSGLGITGYAIEANTTAYSFVYGAVANLTLKRSSRVIDIIGESKRTRLTENGYAIFSDAAGSIVSEFEDFGDDYIMGIERNSNIKKTVLSYRNDKISRNFCTTWQASVEESYHDVDSALRYVRQESGVFYDLLPSGAVYQMDSVKVYADGKQLLPGSYTVETVDNFRNSGHQLLIVRINSEAEKYRLTYTTLYSWDAIKDFGKSLLNTVAYETGNADIGNGRPDDGGSVTEKLLMADLDPESDAKSFVYTQYKYSPSIVTSGNIGLNKLVAGSDAANYSESAIVYLKDSYSYQLRFATDLSEEAKDLILYDSLENYVTREGASSDWRGSLKSVDLSQLIKLGISPVLYYSTEAGLDITEHADLDSSVWVKAADYTGALEDIKAIAVDMRKAENGEDFVMKPDSSASIRVYMQAPALSPEVEEGYPTAYNNVYLNLVHMDAESGEVLTDPVLIHQDYTSVTLRVVGTVELAKRSEFDPEVPVVGAIFRLSGTSDYGTPVNLTAVSAGNGAVLFANVEKGEYILQEIESPDDFFINESLWKVVIDDEGRTFIENIENTAPFEILDKERIHGDLILRKIGEIDHSDATMALPGTTFKLEGTSAYGTVYSVYAVADMSGYVEFRNIELGHYTLTEIVAAEGYQLQKESFKVVCDDSGFMYVEGTNAAARGYTEIINEPYHSFSFFKLNAANRTKVVEGAKFTLNGISDKGTVVSLEAVSDANGIVSFTGLEAGTYILTETEAPENYQLDPTPYTITIANDGTVTGLEKLSSYWTDVAGFEHYFAILNQPVNKGRITVTKKWENDEGEEDKRPIPVVHISTEEPEFDKPYATFDRDKWMSFKKPHAEQVAGDGKSTIKEIRRSYDDAPAANAVKVDDGTTDYSIYAWLDKDTQIIYWWTDAAVAFLDEQADLMFSGFVACTSIDLTGISSARTTSMSYFLRNDKALVSVDLSGLDTSRVEDMNRMFLNCTHIGDIVSDWSILDTSSCKNMEYMFSGVIADEMDISSFDVSKVTNTHRMFQSSKIKKLVMTGMDWSGMTDGAGMAYMFYSCDTEMTVDMSGSDFSKMRSLVGRDLSSNKPMSPFNKSNIKELILRDCDFSGVTELISKKDGSNYSGPFAEMRSLTKLDLSGANFASLTSMKDLFNTNYTNGTSSILTEFSMEGAYTPKLETLNQTFFGCSKLASVNLAGIDATHIVDISAAFANCSALETLVLTDSTFTSLLYASSLFRGCTKLSSIDLSRFNTASVQNMEYMFENCAALTELDLSSFDTSSAANFNNMFKGCTKLKTISVSDKWSVSASAAGSGMFDGCTALVGGNGTIYDSTQIGKTYAHIDGGENTPGYLTAKTAVPFTPYVPEGPEMPVGSTMLMLLPGIRYAIDGDADDYIYDEEGNPVLLEDCFNVQFRQRFSTAAAFRMGDALPAEGVTKYDFIDKENSTPDTHIWLWQDGDTVYWYPEGGDALISYDISEMFAGCTNLKSVDLSGFVCTYQGPDGNEYPMVQNAVGMFAGCTSLEEVNFGSLKFDGCIQEDEYSYNEYGCRSVVGMFAGCTSLKHADLSGLTMEAVSSTAYMFMGCTSLIDVKLPDFAPIEFGHTEGMFAGCSSLETVYVSELWQMVSYSEGEGMFDGCVKLAGQNGTSYSAAHTDWEYARIDETGKPGYFTYMKSTSEEDHIDTEAKTKTYDSLSEMGVEGDLEKWIDNGDGTWSYTFRVFDEDNTYFVWEDDVPNYRGDITVLNPAKIKYAAGQENDTVVITNTKERHDGGLTIRKTVEGDLSREEAERTFSFTVTIPGLSDGWYGSVQFVNGVGTFALKNGQSVSIDRIPANSSYTVTESDYDGFVSSIQNASGTVAADTVVNVIATNTKIVPETGSLVVRKELKSGESGDTVFLFTVTLSGAEIGDENVFGSYVFKNGVLKVALKPNEEITISGIPAGTEYSVTEDLAENYKICSETGTTGVIKTNETAKAVIVNDPLIPVIVPDPEGSFILEKKLNGFESSEKFTFDVVLQGLIPNKEYSLSDGTVFTASAAGSARVTVLLAGGEAVSFVKLPLGTVFSVKEAACAYKASYTISENGNVIASGENAESMTALATVTGSVSSAKVVPLVSFTNAPSVWQFSFAKIDELGSFIAGAGLQIVGENGMLIHEWLSSDEEMETVELGSGSYRFVEISAPLGYLAASSISFSVEEGELVIDGVKSDSAFIEMTDIAAPGIVPDTVVIDYGIPVEIDVCANDVQYENLVSAISTLRPAEADINTGFSAEAFFTGKEIKLSNGSFRVLDNGNILFTPDTMHFKVPIVIYYDTEVSYGNGQCAHLYSSLTVIPATTIYYEDTPFVSFTGDWTIPGKALDKKQTQDRPGFDNLPEIDADSIYGYDPANGECSEYSLGTSHMVTVSAGQTEWPTAEFSFTGTGFDIISLTNKETGFVKVSVYRVDEDGEELLYNWAVDCYYGYTCTKSAEFPYKANTWTYGEDGLWHLTEQLEVAERGTDTLAPAKPTAGDSFVVYEDNYIWTVTDQKSLYQIPVIKSYDTLQYGSYRVVLTPAYSSFFEHVDGSDSYDFYLDAIRIYNPADKSAETYTEVEDAYKQDLEAYPQYIEIRENLINQGGFAKDGSTAEGAVFIDGIPAEGNLGDYTNFGPNNEVYLAKNQSVVFCLSAADAANIASVRLGAKAVCGALSFTVAGKEISLATATDMYYDITDLLNWEDGSTQPIVITNTSGNILSLTTIKICFKNDPAAPAKSVRMTMSPRLLMSVAGAMRDSFIAAHTEEAEEVPAEPAVTEPEEQPAVNPAPVIQEEKPAVDPAPAIQEEKPAAPVEERIEEPIHTEAADEVPEQEIIPAPEAAEPAEELVQPAELSLLMKLLTAVSRALSQLFRLLGIELVH